MTYIEKIRNNKVFKYFFMHPKITTFFVIYFGLMILYFVFKDSLSLALSHAGVFGLFVSGVFYTFGTTGGVAIFTIQEQSKIFDPLFISLIAGTGAGLIDLLTFKYVEKSFSDELHKISELKFFKRLSGYKFISNKYFYSMLGFSLIASPLSDEFGIFFLEKVKELKNIHIFIIGFIVNFIGIYIIASL